MGFVLLALAASACAKGGAGPEADAGPGADGGERDAQAGDAGADAEPADGETDAPPPECTLGADCDDLDPCNGLETCEAGACTPGTPPSCEDGLACSLDSCDPATGECVNALDDSLCADGEVCDSIEGCVLPPPCLVDADCDDGLFCTGIESCDPATGCLRSPPSCDDGLACTDDLCDAGLDACVNTPRDSACSDGVVCNGAESCAPGDPLADGAGCVIGSPPVCDDGVGCTTDYCDESLGGCVVSPDHGACDDLSFCNGVEICDAILGCL
ncbi:MAG: hypothetical protein OEY14_12540, partial [Myxococcales bacterium]|nr:hypothetical protein [Myxococcales bacterium]